MFQDGDAFVLGEQAGIKTLLRQPIEKACATNAAGEIEWPLPVAIDMPFGDVPIAKAMHQSHRVEQSDVFVVEVEKGTLVGHRTFLNAEKTHIFTDSLHSRHTPEVLKHSGRLEFESTHLEYDHDVNAFVEPKVPVSTISIDQDVAVLTTMEYNNYGAFLLRVIPKIIAIRDLGLSDMLTIAPIGLPWQSEIFRTFGVNPDKFLKHDSRFNYTASKLIVPSLRLSEFFQDDRTHALFQELAGIARSRRSAHLPLGKKIYVSRLSQGRQRPNYRFFENEAELAELLTARGFQIIEPERYGLLDQVEIFANADIVVGPGGAGMFNTIFSPPEAVVVDFEPQPNWVALHAMMFGSSRHPYALVLGGSDENDPAPHKRWKTDIPTVLNRLETFGH